MSHGDFLSDFGRKSGVFGKKIWRKLGVSILSYLAVLLICLDFLYLNFFSSPSDPDWSDLHKTEAGEDLSLFRSRRAI